MLYETAALFAKMDRLVPSDLYPPHVLPILNDTIPGTAFFPGGCGLFLEERSPDEVRFPFGGVMILGHNFDSIFGFQNSLKRGKEDLNSGTWRSLRALLADANIPLEECFFTNAFMGLCSGKNNFDYRGRDNEHFRAACLSFLRAQIEFQRPRLIVTLGLHVPPLLAQTSPNLESWRMPTLHLEDIDNAPIFFRVAIMLEDGSGHEANIVAIAHPSLPNSGKRKPQGFPEGRSGEIALMKAGWTALAT